MTQPIYTYYSDAHGTQMQVVDIDATRIAGAPRSHAVEMPADYDPSVVTDEDAHHDSQIRCVEDTEVRDERGWDYDVTDDYERVWRRVERVLSVHYHNVSGEDGWYYQLTTDGEAEDEGPIDDLDDVRSLQQDITEWTTVRCYRIGDERDPEGDLEPVFAHFAPSPPRSGMIRPEACRHCGSLPMVYDLHMGAPGPWQVYCLDCADEDSDVGLSAVSVDAAVRDWNEQQEDA